MEEPHNQAEPRILFDTDVDDAEVLIFDGSVLRARKISMGVCRKYPWV